MKDKENVWKGYSMQELQLHRAINAVRLEVEKEKFLSRLDGLKEGATGNIASFVVRNLGTFSRGLAITSAVVGIGRKVYSMFKK